MTGRDLVVTRGHHVVLHGVDFDIPAGQVTGLIGPSGCGKTTLIRAVVGTQVIDAGQVQVLGFPAGAPQLRGRIGYGSQSAAVYPDLTVVENVRYFASTLRAPASDVTRVLEQVDLAGHRGQLVGQLSGGERSRVSLAVALLGTPQLVVLDEPTVGLDPVLREQLWALFAELAAGGLTLLVSSHVMDEARRCEQLLLMRAGNLLACESPQSLIERTGTANLDEAFLYLIKDTVRAP